MKHETSTDGRADDVVIGITGASGAPYTVSLLKALKGIREKGGIRVHLIISSNGKKILRHETKKDAKDIRQIADFYYENEDLTPPIASGSVPFLGMVIVPASMNTVSKIAHGIEDNLITRVAQVCVKEKRTLIVVPRETPLSVFHLEAMKKLAEAGAVVLPAMPAFYTKPASVEDMINFVVQRILDHLFRDRPETLAGYQKDGAGNRWDGNIK